jgi:oligopeptide/dipeptide ABC transporter ATP-binding protein
MSEPILQTRHLNVRFGRGDEAFHAVRDVNFEARTGEAVGVVGESGSGKTTLARVLVGLQPPTSGSVTVDGQDVYDGGVARTTTPDAARRVQIIFQDPYSSLNPRMTVGHIIAEPMRVHGILPKDKIEARVGELLQLVGLYGYMALRYPHELSGGQRQRVGIARALAVNPQVIVCDEAVSALDVSIQGQVINLLEQLQKTLGLTYLFIAHDLAVVRHISTKVAVMYLGRIVEYARSGELFASPKHPYTQALLAAAPVPDPEIEKTRPRKIITGELPSPLNPPAGCVFHPRCPLATEACKQAIPPERELAPDHFVACIHA